MPLNAPTRSSLKHAPLKRVAAVALLCAVFVLLTGLVDGGVGVMPQRLLAQPSFPLANAWPGLLLAGLLLALTRRALFAFALAFAAQGVVYAVNALKVDNLGTPLLPADFRIVGQLRRGGLHLLSGYLPQNPWVYLGLVAIVVVVVALWRMERPLLPRRPRATRLASAGVLAIGLASVLAGSAAWGHVYNGRVLWMEPWSASSTSAHSGLISSLIMFRLQFAKPRAKPDQVAALQLINQFDPQLRQSLNAATPARELPDIVVVQSESFFDPSIMRGYERGNFTPNLRRLAAHGVSGALHVPTFGGGTIRTEFEVLTGLSLRYFDELQFPYLQMNHKQVPGLVRALNAQGYQTIALHGNDPAFWNRSTAFKALGFDQFLSQQSFPADVQNDGKYMADSAMTDAIVAQLKESGPPQFIFAISIEAHGPYDVSPRDVAERDAIPVPDAITGKDKLELQNYLYHLRHADAELGRLVTLLAQRRRPVRVLFYGDHLPALSDVYATTGFVDGRGMLPQPSTWLLVDPHDTSGTAVKVDTAAWLLPGQLLGRLGLHTDGYFALTELVGPQLAALTQAPGASASGLAADAPLDRGMRSVSQLRMNGKLEKLLPAAEVIPADIARRAPPAKASDAGRKLLP
ncbi:MAG: LTA synthase family protein [Rhodanobacter sp.]